MKNKLVITIIILIIFISGCRDRQSATENISQTQATTPVTELPDDSKVTEEKIRFLEDRIKNDQEDMIAYNMLGKLYLQKLRETGDVNYLILATKSAKASLAVLPEQHNEEGLRVLAETEFSSHNFKNSRELGERLSELIPNKIFPYQIIGDSLLELGEYDKAESLLSKMAKLDDHSSFSSVIIEIRLSRLEFLQGNTDKSEKHLKNALNLALNSKPIQRELIAWLHWQLGENDLAIGKYDQAEQYFKNSLTSFPNYYRAMASMGRVKAAQGKITEAITQLQNVTKIIPDPTYIATLGDLYQLNGQQKEAEQQYKLVEQIGKLSELNGTLYNRNLALFYADHEMNTSTAYEYAVKEYQERRDIYGSDAVAWTALKAGKLPEAQTAIKDALKLGTKDARIFYHAGLIAQAAGDRVAARDYLERALKLNPQFDPIQASNCKKVLNDLSR